MQDSLTWAVSSFPLLQIFTAVAGFFILGVVCGLVSMGFNHPQRG